MRKIEKNTNNIQKIQKTGQKTPETNKTENVRINNNNNNNIQKIQKTGQKNTKNE